MSVEDTMHIQIEGTKHPSRKVVAKGEVRPEEIRAWYWNLSAEDARMVRAAIFERVLVAVRASNDLMNGGMASEVIPNMGLAALIDWKNKAEELAKLEEERGRLLRT